VVHEYAADADRRTTFRGDVEPLRYECEHQASNFRPCPQGCHGQETGLVGWPCFWLERAGRVELGLRRYTWRDSRPAGEPVDWMVDAPSTSGGHWHRDGDPRDPPSLTVSPSIAAGEPGTPGYYHGHLQAGQLTGHLG
jgi:hypothetical protein